VTALAPDGFTRARFTSGGTEANEMALRMARQYHTERGDRSRRLVISAKAYHGASMATLALSGRAGLQSPFEPYMRQQRSIMPVSWRDDPGGTAALAGLDREIARAGPGNVAAVLLEPVSAMALPGYTPPDAFWQGLDARCRRHGILIWLDEVVTAFGRAGSWFAAGQIPVRADIITFGKGLGAGFMPLAGMIVREHVYQAVAQGSRSFEHGHTWDGAPLSCAAGLAVLSYLRRHQLPQQVADRGPRFLESMRAALEGCPLVREVRGRGFLLGISYASPRDRDAFPDPALQVARQVDAEALGSGVIIRGTQPTADGYAGDQTTIAPPFTATGAELDWIVQRVSESVRAVADRIAVRAPVTYAG
jgi:adenosylmethionine-8-amino-7-oxononanoate aminotransferase